MFEKEQKEYLEMWAEETIMSNIQILDKPAVGFMRQWRTNKRFNIQLMCESCIHMGFELKHADEIGFCPACAYKALACYEFCKSFTKEDCEHIIKESHTPKWKKISAEELLVFFNEVSEAAQRLASRSKDFAKSSQSYSTETAIETI